MHRVRVRVRDRVSASAQKEFLIGYLSIEQMKRSLKLVADFTN